MDDSQVEDLLRRYRPVGPPPRLRGRIFATAPNRRTWPWASAAAALLVSALALQVALGHEVSTADIALGSAVDTRVLDDLTDLLGGDMSARQLAELILAEQQLRSETTNTIPLEPSLLPGEDLR